MPTPIEYAAGPAGHALKDLADAMDQAKVANDKTGLNNLRELLFDHLQEKLASKPDKAIRKYAASRSVWRVDDGHSVFKTADEPCLAYTAFETNGDVSVLALGFCYRYPVSEEAWWTDVIRPRLRQHI